MKFFGACNPRQSRQRKIKDQILSLHGRIFGVGKANTPTMDCCQNEESLQEHP
jgi:hypothetical protein